MQSLKMNKTKGLALLTGAAIMGSTLATTTAPAQAADKEKLYKGGAIARGVLGGYGIVKGKTIPGAAAAAGAYYAYKQGKKEGDREDRNANGDIYPDGRYSYNERNSGDTYPYYAPSFNGGTNYRLK